MEEWIKIVLLFYLYSFMGWLWETVYCSLKAKKFVYRGFLVGPITPIYGFGILGVLYFVRPFQNNLLVLYLLSMLLVTALEYVTSYALEKLFHATWWDYKHVPFNINGRVALPVSLFWGIACVFIVEVLHPQMLLIESWLAKNFGIVLPILLVVLTLGDLIYTVTNMSSFKKVTAELSDIIETSQREIALASEERRAEITQNLSEVREELEERVNELQEKLKEHQKAKEAKEQTWLEYLVSHEEISNRIPKLNFNQRRILKNFPNLRPEKIKNRKDFQQLVDAIKRNKR